jgi:hypothetical protein
MLKELIFFWKQRNFWKLRKKNPAQIFCEVYSNNTWGGKPGEFYSGSGTANPSTRIYIDNIVGFLEQHGISTIAELGCGDFRIMNEVLRKVNVDYVGIDVVKALIDFNNTTFGNATTRFERLDIIEGTLPQTDLVIIRQVLQHLSNAEIAKILKKISAYRWALITEHVPIGDDVVHNIDKIHGPHIRMKANSGVFIDKPPFNIANTTILFEYREDDPVKGKLVPAVMRTYLVQNR